MTRSATIALFVVGITLLVIVLGNPFYVVKEGTQVVITRFGEPVSGTISKTGLHIKTPFVEDVNRFESRILEWDGDANQIPTKNKRFIWIDTTARWRIADPLVFLKSVGDINGAMARLDDILDSVARDIITEQPLHEIVRSSNRELPVSTFGEEGEISKLVKGEVVNHGREKLMRDMLEHASVMTPRYGIELIDVRIKRIIYIDQVLNKIYERMVAERRRAAEQFRSEGQGRKAEVEGLTDRDLNKIRSEAYKTSQEIKGEADAEAAHIFAEAYNLNPELYSFLKTLKTYEDTIDENTTLVLSTDTDYFKYLKNVKP
ncbi:MAG: membrane protease subunit HflC [Candidatus Omnitrophota bacterium]|jgi:membrane protease subunit HflC